MGASFAKAVRRTLQQLSASHAARPAGQVVDALERLHAAVDAHASGGAAPAPPPPGAGVQVLSGETFALVMLPKPSRRGCVSRERTPATIRLMGKTAICAQRNGTLSPPLHPQPPHTPPLSQVEIAAALDAAAVVVAVHGGQARARCPPRPLTRLAQPGSAVWLVSLYPRARLVAGRACTTREQ
jgi:hypothetical protein